MSPEQRKESKWNYAKISVALTLIGMLYYGIRTMKDSTVYIADKLKDVEETKDKVKTIVTQITAIQYRQHDDSIGLQNTKDAVKEIKEYMNYKNYRPQPKSYYTQR